MRRVLLTASPQGLLRQRSIYVVKTSATLGDPEPEAL